MIAILPSTKLGLKSASGEGRHSLKSFTSQLHNGEDAQWREGPGIITNKPLGKILGQFITYFRDTYTDKL